MTIPAPRPIWEQHPLWLDRGRLEDICDRMWIVVQRVMFKRQQPRPRESQARTEPTIVGGASAEDVYAEATRDLLRYEPSGETNWEKVGVKIARSRAIDAVRKATKHRHLPDGSEIAITSLDLENKAGERVFDKRTGPGELVEDEAIEHVLRADRLIALRAAAEDVLSERDRTILFRVTRGESNVAIAPDVDLTPQRVGQIYRESLRKVNARLRQDPKYRRLYEPEGGNPDD